MLSERARRFLDQCERTTAVPTADAERILRAGGWPTAPAWLEFHDRYAGYVERIYRDAAVWGLRLSEQRAPAQVVAGWCASGPPRMYFAAYLSDGNESVQYAFSFLADIVTQTPTVMRGVKRLCWQRRADGQ
jgi:hypothetical protein